MKNFVDKAVQCEQYPISPLPDIGLEIVSFSIVAGKRSVHIPDDGREKPKTREQRKKFHKMYRNIGNFIGLTLGNGKEAA